MIWPYCAATREARLWAEIKLELARQMISGGRTAYVRVVFLILVGALMGGCGTAGPSHLASNEATRSHNKLATKVLADIAVRNVRGAMPSRVARRRGLETL